MVPFVFSKSECYLTADLASYPQAEDCRTSGGKVVVAVAGAVAMTREIVT